MDWQPHEDERILRAGKDGGEILNEIGLIICLKDNPARKITKDEWLSFLRSVIGKHAELEPEYKNRFEELNDDIPF